MTTIYELSSLDKAQGGDQVLIYSPSSGLTTKLSLSHLLTYMQDAFQATGGSLENQYAAPSATGFSITINPTVDGTSMYLNITPVAAYAAGTIVLPALAEVVSGQEILVTSTQSVSALTVSGNGATVTGAPTTLGVNGFFRLRFNSIFNSWMRIG